MLRLVKPRAVARRLSTLEAPVWGREEFYAQTRLPVEQATTLAPELYTDDAVLAHESRTLFRRNWVCVGHASELARHGDVMPVDLPGNQPLFLANNKGTINAFHNVCRHRGARLVEKKGRHNMISCPYHRWGYALSGELKGTPCWDTSEVAGAGGDGIDPGKGRGDQIPPHVRARFDTGHVVNFDKKDYGLFGCGVAPIVLSTMKPNLPAFASSSRGSARCICAIARPNSAGSGRPPSSRYSMIMYEPPSKPSS